MDLKNTRAAAIAIAEQAVAQEAQRLRNEVVEQLSQEGKGRTYEFEREFLKGDGTTAKVGQRRGVPHTASAPGDPPAVDTGRLRQSIVALKIAPGRWRVGTNVEYAFWLEFGTRRIAPRPFMRPAAEKVRRG
ncbi:hypothetical protein DAETH_28920 [Deinococcus aetherius]|uniref:Uncharacterized protein n=1 Tax=Deinococcus aetherius TaxID=200252 RepID=A0ABN6RLN2_9DEIO|nr:hypothetical protein [Deinococcus aetherius]BDP42923.1 hypothetical protein DAETH_28920 [Deinococcus aetherius]